ncbi:MAG: methyl-accepting chemotaxis protein [Bacillota bacterium]|nr:methyl-accepting chemotaxis protein [Bacillota bacterium]
MKKIDIYSFKVKLIASMLLLFLIPIIIISLVIDNQMKSQLKNDFISSTTNEIHQVDTTISTFFEGIKENVQMMSQNPLLMKTDGTIKNYLTNNSDETKMTPSKNGGLEAQIYNEFLGFAVSHPKYTYVYMGSEKGGYIQWPEATIMKNYDPRQRPFYLTAMANKGKVTVSNPYYWPADKTYGISVVSTFNDEKGQLAGVAGMDVSLNEMTDMVKAMKVGQRGYVILVDAKGTIIAHPNKSELNFKNISELNTKGLEDISKITNTNFETSVDGKSSFINTYSSEKTGWKYIAVIEKSDVMAGATRVEMVILVLVLIFLVLAVFVIFITAGKFSNPISDFVEVLKSVKMGDFTRDVPKKLLNRKDEMGILATALSDMIDNVSSVLGRINISAEQVASASGQIASSSQALSQGATEQASSIEEITASIEQLSSQTKLNASNATNANNLANEARMNAEQGNLKMQEMLKSMAEINDASTSISKIIKVIDEIAFQTNILALNAAVEAARAGQNGKGFAVVADEVRNLAGRSASAAEETTSMIEGSIKKVEAGTQIANLTAKALSNIVEGVAEAANLVGEIATSSNDQASGIAQINQAIIQVSQVVQSNSATSEEVAASSQEMSAQAENLKESINTFKLKPSENANINFNNISPEILKMLENISKSNQKEALKNISQTRKNSDTSIAKIALSDKEFGKY